VSETAYSALLARKGVALDGLGLREIALHRDDASKAVSLLAAAGIAILGGDVYLARGGAIEIAYANWHADRQAGEDSSHFAQRSARVANDYISRYPADGEAAPLFVIVRSGDIPER
jgi:hypothetical protein